MGAGKKRSYRARMKKAEANLQSSIRRLLSSENRDDIGKVEADLEQILKE